MARTEAYAVLLGPLSAAQLRVESFRGREAMNELYRYDIRLTCRAPTPVFERLVLSRRGVFAMRVGGRVRCVHGICSRIRSEGVQHVASGDVHRYSVRLVPKLWLSTRRRGSHIFRATSVADVISEVVGRVGAHADMRVMNGAPSDYLTQYEETDFELIRRLAAESGIAFHFEQPPSILGDAMLRATEALSELGPLGDLAAMAASFVEAELGPEETVVFHDTPAYPPLADGEPLLSAHAVSAAAGDHEFVESFTRTRGIRSTTAVFRDYDPRTPLAALEASYSLGEGRVSVESIAPVEPEGLEIYDHGGRALAVDWADGKREPTRMLDAARRRAELATGKATSARLEPGRTFLLDDHSEHSGAYVVVSARLRGAQSFDVSGESTAFSNDFECVPAPTFYPMPVPKRRVVQACLTATVVGPAGNDIHVNESGEICVRFHWDRREHGESTWIRTMHAWGGAGWGSQFIPRVGMEVVVGFEAGDPDKPIVLGAVYNKIKPPPFALPRHRTRSGFRTQSSPSGNGYNEVSFDDEAGAEQVYIRAERDLETLARRNRGVVVEGEDSLRVTGDRVTEVSGEERATVAKRRAVVVHGDADTRVDDTMSVDVGGDLQTSVARDRVTRVAELDRVEVGELALVSHGDVSGDVRGSATLLVGRDDDKRSLSARVEGTTQLSSSQTVDISSDKEVILRSGNSTIRVHPGGIEIVAGEVTVCGKDARVLLKDGDAKWKVAGVFQVVSDDFIVLKASGASLGLDSRATMHGSAVSLQSAKSASDSIESSSTETTTIELVDEDGNAIPYQRFRIVARDGSETTGFLDANGQAKLVGATAGNIIFPDVADVEQG